MTHPFTFKDHNYLSITTHYQHNLSLSGADNNSYQNLRAYPYSMASNTEKRT